MAIDPSNPFASHFEQWGPDAAPCDSRDEAERYCRQLATGHYENFPVRSIAVPRHLRQPLCNVYAFCRWADDLGDEIPSSTRSLELLAWWKDQLESCYSGSSTHPVFVALQPTITDFHLPAEPFRHLIDAFIQDQTKRDCDTFPELINYCERSANPVGRIVLHLFGKATADRIALSDDVCTGLQLINFWQDVARDAAIGRTYLPREDRRRFGYSDEMLARRETNTAFTDLLRFEVERARELLLSGQLLCRQLSGRLRLVIEMFYRGGLLICHKIERNGYRVWDDRPTVSKRDAVGLLPKAASAMMLSAATGGRR